MSSTLVVNPAMNTSAGPSPNTWYAIDRLSLVA
jgi:hypothetical protein